MSDASNVAKSLRERLSENTEDRLGKALSDLLENPLITGAIGRAFDAREKASQAQEVAMGALNIPSAADIERLTRRLRSVSHRLEGIEDGVHRLDRALSPNAVESRLSAIEQQLGKLTDKLKPEGRRPSRAAAAAKPTRSKVKPTKAKRAKAKAATKTKASKAKVASKAKASKAKATTKAKASKAKAAGKAKATKAKRKVKAKAASKTRAAAKRKPASKAKAAGKAKATKAKRKVKAKAASKAKPARGRAKPTRSKAKARKS
jgi:hypothetical protein